MLFFRHFFVSITPRAVETVKSGEQNRDGTQPPVLSTVGSIPPRNNYIYDDICQTICMLPMQRIQEYWLYRSAFAQPISAVRLFDGDWYAVR